MLKKYKLEYPIEQQLEDFDVLEDIMNGKTNINSIDNELKIRLIAMCNQKLESLEQKIYEKRHMQKNSIDNTSSFNYTGINNMFNGTYTIK